MAITTTSGHGASAYNFFNVSEVYVGIGRTSPWDDELNPPAPDINDSELDELIGLKKVETRYMVVPDAAGSIIYRDTRWRPISADIETIRNEGCKWVYIEAHINYDELPLSAFRQVGIFSHITKADGVPVGQFNLLPSEVDDLGFLEVIDNRTVVTRQLDQRETITMVMEF